MEGTGTVRTTVGMGRQYMGAGTPANGSSLRLVARRSCSGARSGRRTTEDSGCSGQLVSWQRASIQSSCNPPARILVSPGRPGEHVHRNGAVRGADLQPFRRGVLDWADLALPSPDVAGRVGPPRVPRMKPVGQANGGVCTFWPVSWSTGASLVVLGPSK